MRKLSLDVDSLVVESFEALALVATNAGTVRAHGESDTCKGPNCPNCGCKDSTLA